MILCVCVFCHMSRARTNIKSTKRLVCLYQNNMTHKNFFSLYYGRKAKGAGVRGKERGAREGGIAQARHAGAKLWPNQVEKVRS